MERVPPSIREFTEREAELRRLHGEGSLYVKPMVYVKGPDTIVVGGWAFLDGEPAMIPDGLTLLTVTHEVGGELVTVGRDPAAVLALLGARVTKQSTPCPHYTVTVRESDKAALLAEIGALPEHRPAPARPIAYAPMTEAPPSDGMGAWILIALMVLVILAIVAAMALR
jgi:hypothetical protein